MLRGDVISYLDMCRAEGVNLQRGMNYRLNPRYSVILMSVRAGAPYADRVEEAGCIVIYEGHDEPRQRGGPDPKSMDQPLTNPGGTPTQNGLFFEAATAFKKNSAPAELVKVYEKIRAGIWVYNGYFELIDAHLTQSDGRKVCKFKLRLAEVNRFDDLLTRVEKQDPELSNGRVIPTTVKVAVYSRDKGRCVLCGSQANLHFDHIIPYAKGGSSLVAENIQLLCAKHNLAKHDSIQ